MNDEPITPHNASPLVTLLLIQHLGGTVHQHDGMLYVRGVKDMPRELSAAIKRNRAALIRMAGG